LPKNKESNNFKIHYVISQKSKIQKVAHNEKKPEQSGGGDSGRFR